MITFKVEFSQMLTPGQRVQGTLIVDVTEVHNLTSITMELKGEQVTRKVVPRGRSRTIKTDRSHLMNFLLTFFQAPSGSEPFKPGQYRYTFEMDVSAGFPASANLHDAPFMTYLWCDRRKYEINYLVVPSAHQSNGPPFGATINIDVFENPYLPNYHQLLSVVPYTEEGETEVNEGLFSKSTSIAFQVSSPRRYYTTGEFVNISMFIENKTKKKEINNIQVQLFKTLEYDILGEYFKKYNDSVSIADYPCRVLPGSSEPMTAGIQIPQQIPASTPHTIPRKLKVSYAVVIDYTADDKSMRLHSFPIIVSNLAFPALTQ